MKTCYECDKDCNYLFDDGRCKDCTRLTPEEVRGETIDFGDEDDSEEHY